MGCRVLGLVPEREAFDPVGVVVLPPGVVVSGRDPLPSGVVVSDRDAVVVVLGRELLVSMF